MLALGFLTKGFVAFFPWTFPFIFWLSLRQKSFWKMIIDTAGIFIFTLAPLLMIIILFPVVRLSLHKYIDNQVISSIRTVVTVDSRFDIVKRLFSELAPAAVLCILFLVWMRIKKSSTLFVKENNKKALAFLLLGLTGVLPVMISMKQSGFYIVPTYPFFAIGISILLYHSIDALFINLNYKSKGFLFFKLIAYGLFFTGVFLSIYFSDHFSRDKNKIKDSYAIFQEIPQGSVININPEMYKDWSLHAYFSRFKNISLDPNLNNRREYLLIKNEDYSDSLNLNYKIVKLKTTDYQLFKKK
jgi:hypothetical protein